MLFGVKYRELRTSVPYNEADMHDTVSSLKYSIGRFTH